MESITSCPQFACVFTVVSNPFLALECTEHTDYDLIFISNESSCDCLSAFDFMKILRSVNACYPIILLTDKHKEIPSDSPGLPVVGFNTDTLQFAAILQYPYTQSELRKIIFQYCTSSLRLSSEALATNLPSSNQPLLLPASNLLIGTNATNMKTHPSETFGAVLSDFEVSVSLPWKADK